MNYFLPSSSLKEESKTPDGVVPLLILSRNEIVERSKNLPFALPALVTATRNGKSQGAGKNRSGENITFPPPKVISRLNKVYTICQSINLGTVSSSTTVPTFSSQAVTFAQLDQASSLTNVFDQYRIALLEITYQPRATQSTSGQNLGLFHTVVDVDDDTNLTTIASALDYQGCQRTQGDMPHKHTFVPHIAVAAYSGVFTSFANETAPWIDAGSTGVKHYGCKTAWSTSTAIENYDVLCRVLVQLRNVR